MGLTTCYLTRRACQELSHIFLAGLHVLNHLHDLCLLLCAAFSAACERTGGRICDQPGPGALNLILYLT